MRRVEVSDDRAISAAERGSSPARHRAGLTLIELAVAFAILAVLTTMGIVRYGTFVYRARIVTAVFDIKNISTAIKGFEIASGFYPDSLVEVGMHVLRDPWGNPYQYLNISDHKKVTGNKNNQGGKDKDKDGDGGGGKEPRPRKDRFLVPINTKFDLYSMGKDGQSKMELNAKASRDDVVRARDGGFIGLASEF